MLESVSVLAAPASVKEALDQLVTLLQTQPGVCGLILFGGIPRGRYLPGISDVNLAVILEHASGPALAELGPPLQAASQRLHLTPLILEESEVGRLADVYPVKILDIQRNHVVLWGSDPFQGLKVHSEHIRLHLEQGLRDLCLRLRRQAVLGNGDARRQLLEVTRPLAVHLAELLRLVGAEPPDDRTRTIFPLAAERFHLDGQALQTLVALREGQPVLCTDGLYGDVLTVLTRAAAVADRLQVAS